MLARCYQLIVFSRTLWLASVCCMFLAACVGTDRHLLKEAYREEGVSRALAQFRKSEMKDVQYALHFALPEEKQQPVTGKVEITCVLQQPMPLILDFRGKQEQIRLLTLNGEKSDFRFENEHIIIEKEAVDKGTNRVEIHFTASDQSLNRRDEFMYTLLVPDRARTLFPCFDQPDMKALYTLSLDIPSTWQAVANGAVGQVDSLSADGRKQILFKQTEPLSTYLFSFVAGRLEKEIFRRDKREIAVYHRETDPAKKAQCADIAEEVLDALDWLEAYTDMPYPFAKYDLVILPGFQFGGMEHAGATLYTDQRMFLNENPTLNERLSRSSLIAHETAHMWFGDFVTMKWFDDVWTKEVFANYFASQMVEPLFPEVNHTLNFMLDYLPAAYSEDRTRGTTPIKQTLDNLRDAGLVYGNIIYTKSPVVLAMLVRIMGKEAFRRGIQTYLKTYAYENATWENLIAVLQTYTAYDLKYWSKVWVHEKGMPEISTELKDRQLFVTQSDSWNRGICWPQKLTFHLVYAGHTDTLSVEMTAESAVVSIPIPANAEEEKPVVVPNADGKGYGYFRIDRKDFPELLRILCEEPNETIRGSLLISLNENLLNGQISPEQLMDGLSLYVIQEKNPLLFSAALGYLVNCQRRYLPETASLEHLLWQIVSESTIPAHRLQAFRYYRASAASQEALDRLFSIWKTQQPPKGCILSENDYLQLAYQLSIRKPEWADEIMLEQRSRIANPDRRQQFDFVAPSVSPLKSVRDSVFNSLLIAANRRVEPWVLTALGNLNHTGRQQQAVAYIRPALEIMQEIQRTGDIFFPRNWARILLDGHDSEAAKEEVDRFFKDHPAYPVMLENKIRQSADHLYR